MRPAVGARPRGGILPGEAANEVASKQGPPARPEARHPAPPVQEAPHASPETASASERPRPPEDPGPGPDHRVGEAVAREATAPAGEARRVENAAPPRARRCSVPPRPSGKTPEPPTSSRPEAVKRLLGLDRGHEQTARATLQWFLREGPIPDRREEDLAVT
jgi:hypothetical protein